MSQDNTFNIVRDYLLEQINSHNFSWEESLPSEHQLAEHFNVSRATVRAVYQQLFELGYIESRQGIGHFIKEKLPKIDLVMRGDQSFSQKMLAQGLNYTSKIIDIKETNHDFIYRRLRLIDEIPIAIHQSKLPKLIFPNFINEIGQETSLFNYLRYKGYEYFDSTRTSINTSIPNKEERELLQCESLASLIILEGNCIDAQEQIKLEESRITYRADIINFRLV